MKRALLLGVLACVACLPHEKVEQRADVPRAEVTWQGRSWVRPLDGGESRTNPDALPTLDVGFPVCPTLPMPEEGDWLEVESLTSTSARIRSWRHPVSGKLVGYFYAVTPWQANATVKGEGKPVHHWVIGNLGPGIEWKFELHEIGKTPKPEECPFVLGWSSVEFELPYGVAQ